MHVIPSKNILAHVLKPDLGESICLARFMEWVTHKHMNSTFVSRIIVRCLFHELEYRIIFIAFVAGPIILRYRVISSAPKK